MLSCFVRFFLPALCVPLFFTCSAITNFIISDQDEIDMGVKFKAQILADKKNYPEYKKDATVISYINQMGQTLAQAQRDRTNIPFSFTIIDTNIVNAFSVPGGPIFIYKGLLKKANSGAEVAAVLAHELGHITMRHGAKKMAELYGVQIVEQILFGSDSSSAATIANLLAGMAFLKVSRNDEYQADSCGISYSLAARYNPYGMVNFFQTLYNLYGDTPFEVFSDHPATSERIDNARRLISKTRGAPTSAADTTGLHMAEWTAVKSRL